MVIKLKNMRNNNMIKLVSFFLGLIILSQGCKEDELLPLTDNQTPPGIVSNISVENGPGKAKITYSLPNEKDLLYVKAVYTLNSGKEYEVKSSIYNSSLEVVGFGDTDEHTVKLYSVNRSEVVSTPVEVKVKPQENAIWSVYRSLGVIADFAGIKLTAKNTFQSDLAIEVLVQKDGKYVPSAKNIYTKVIDIDQSVRGFDTVSQKFAITIRDRWLNYSDTLYATLKPLYETALPKADYRPIALPTDATQEYTSTSLSYMWDGNIMDWPRISLTKTTILTPQWVTFDLGKPATLSRIMIWDYPEYLNAGRTYYYGGGVNQFEIWGSDNPPADGSFTNWTLMGTFQAKKPSGSAYGVQTGEDYAAANAGFSYSLKIGAPKVRYLRIKNNKNWQGTTFMSVAEVLVYGDPR
jgi:hypothetical protein